MVSIIQSMNELDRQSTLLSLALRSYAGTIEDIERRIVRHCFPRSGGEQRSELARLHRALLEQPETGMPEVVRQRLSGVLTECEAQISKWLSGGTDLKDVLGALEKTTHKLQEGGIRQQTRLRSVALALEATAEVEDTDELRRQLLGQARRLDEAVNQIRQDIEGMLADLNHEILSYRTRLAKAEAEAATDPLTGLPNRRALEKTMEQWIEQQRCFSLILMDLDRFKFINDTYGHLAGDELLQAFSGRLKGRLGEGEVGGRWAGDEFLVLVPGALSIAMSKVRRWQPELCGRYALGRERASLRIDLSVTFGMAERKAGESPEQLFARADKILLRDKAVG